MKKFVYIGSFLAICFIVVAWTVSERSPEGPFQYALEIDGKAMGFFPEAYYIGSENESVFNKVSLPNGSQVLRKIPGVLSNTDVGLRRGITSNMDLWDWRQQVVDGGANDARSNFSIVLYDSSNTEIRRWDFTNGWPRKIQAPVADVSGDGVYEEIVLAHDGLVSAQTMNPSVKIAAILPLTGDLQPYGEQVRNGADIAVRDYNQNRSSGKSVGLLYRDTKSAIDSNETFVAEAVADSSVLAVLGGAVSETTLQLADLCADNQMALFSPTATSAQLANKDYAAKVVPLDQYQVDAMNSVLENYGLGGDVFIVAEDSPYGNGFFALADREGVNLIGNYVFPSHELKAAEAIESLEAAFQTSNPVVVLALYEDDAASLLTALSQSNSTDLPNATFLLSDGATTDSAIANLPSFSEGVYSPQIFGLTPIVPKTQTAAAFAAKYKERFHAEPNWFSYYGRDAAEAFLQILQKNEALGRGDVWSKVPWLRFEGVSGSKVFDENGNLYSAGYDLQLVVKGEWKAIETILAYQNSQEQPQGSFVISKLQSFLKGWTASSAETEFVYRLNGDDPAIDRFAGESTGDGGWSASSLDAPLGGVLMAYYEDIERGASVVGEPFVFIDGKQYYLTFELSRGDLSNEAPSEGDILQLTVDSVYRSAGSDSTAFNRKTILNRSVSFADWPAPGALTVTFPIEYQSAAPEGTAVDSANNLFHWELKLMNAAQQTVVLSSVEIATDRPTPVKDFMMYENRSASNEKR